MDNYQLTRGKRGYLTTDPEQHHSHLHQLATGWPLTVSTVPLTVAVKRLAKPVILCAHCTDTKSAISMGKSLKA